jgi:hypothetical protein
MVERLETVARPRAPLEALTKALHRTLLIVAPVSF